MPRSSSSNELGDLIPLGELVAIGSPERDKERRLRSRNYEEKRVDKGGATSLIKDGYKVVKSTRQHDVLSKDKNAANLLEDRAWLLLDSFKVSHLNRGRNFRLQYGKNQKAGDKQIDVFGFDEETKVVFILECKSRSGSQPSGMQSNHLNEFSHIWDEYQKIVGPRGGNVVLLFATSNIDWKDGKREEAGDLIFADPPYTVKHNKNGFIGYNEKIFSWADQERLANALGKAAQNGVKLIITNANHESIHQLYYFAEPHIFSRTSLIAGSAQRRGLITEAIFTANIGLSQGQNTTTRN